MKAPLIMNLGKRGIGIATAVSLLAAALVLMALADRGSSGSDQGSAEAAKSTPAKSDSTRPPLPAPGQGRLQIAAERSLEKGESAFVEWLEAGGTEERGSLIELAADAALRAANSKGEITQLKTVMTAIGPIERIEVFHTKILELATPLGAAHDIDAMLDLAREVKSYSQEKLREEVFEKAAERLDELNSSGFLSELAPSDFALLCGSVAQTNGTRAFDAAAEARDEESRRTAAARVMSQILKYDSYAAAEKLSEIPEGLVRDEATAEMIVWLVGRGSSAEALPWLDQIADPTARDRAARALSVEEP